MVATLVYVSAATNRFSQAADISPSSSLVSFGSARSVALWDLEWKNTANIQAHSKAISTLCVQGNRVITGSSDSSIKIWSFVEGNEKDNFVEKQTIELQGRYPLASALAYLPQTNVAILAFAGTNTEVQLWVCSEDIFVQSATLSGHEDWIRSLSFKILGREDSPLVLASGSQDSTIRLWNIEPWKKISPTTLQNLPAGPTDELLDNFEASLGDLVDGEEGGRQVSLKHHILTVKTSATSSQQFSVTFDALLVGHEAGVTSLSWRESVHQTPTLLSTSTDSSVILWSPSSVTSPNNESSSIWINKQRFGDVGGQRLGGFLGGLWANSGKDVLAWGWAGAISGHSGPIKGLDWSPDGSYIISAGLDQTTRIHAPVHASQGRPSWHEIARPQVHGYDVLNVVFIDPLKFASIADEKVVRVFEAPRNFVELAGNLGVSQFADKEYKRPLGANVPPLGLSNKAVTEGPQELPGGPIASRRPFDGELASITLWPETEKIYGHGYESITLAVSTSRTLIATACKSTNAEHAVVRVYDTTSYKPVGAPLSGHVLTVTRIAFSPDDRYILTVSRDRSWRLFELQVTGAYTPTGTDKSHGRIIWDCAWAAEGDIFATASRDKTVKIWEKGNGHWNAISTIKTSQAATAVAFAPGNGEKRRLAIGLENGEILIYWGLCTTTSDWRLDETVCSRLAHVDHIHRMAWRPSSTHPDELATCSEDGTLRILKHRFLSY
ncbi:hypothetical protein M413DRAFT_16963 [Hebeloma cylindrosporum]|uniref:Elongator complex protein 2 n=1 Tax=Hebeloma cylindrosporum TaxID=76867 RepID=A0A0C3CQ78_HEBCY|nr:hypothetical protein M413DRAFT_16963 [Hebeloma cylindrosporum h7]